MDEFDNLRQSKQAPGEESVYVVEALNEGVEEFYLTMVHPSDIDQQGLPLEAIVGRLKSLTPPGESPFTTENIDVNPVFVAFLQDVARRRGPEDPELIASAKDQKEGIGLMADRRCVVAGHLSREDVIGSFEIKNGKIMPESYEENEFYEIVSENGFMTLGSWLEGVLLEELLLKFGDSLE